MVIDPWNWKYLLPPNVNLSIDSLTLAEIKPIVSFSDLISLCEMPRFSLQASTAVAVYSGLTQRKNQRVQTDEASLQRAATTLYSLVGYLKLHIKCNEFCSASDLKYWLKYLTLCILSHLGNYFYYILFFCGH